jgi:hypothetical protein
MQGGPARVRRLPTFLLETSMKGKFWDVFWMVIDIIMIIVAVMEIVGICVLAVLSY